MEGFNETLKFLRGKIGEQGASGVVAIQSIDITDTHLNGGLKVPVLLKDADAKGSLQNWYYEFSETDFHAIDWRAVL